MKLPVVVLLASVALLGCAKEPVEDPRVSAAKSYVADMTRDPSAVQFRDVELVTVNTRAGDTQVVCGEFNGKNAMGGYVGFNRFLWMEGEGAVILPEPNHSGHAQVKRDMDLFCSGRLPSEHR